VRGDSGGNDLDRIPHLYPADQIRHYDQNDLQRFERFAGAVMVGTCSRYTVIDTDEQRAVLGVNFRPGGAFQFLGLPAGELQDGYATLETLWGPRGRRLRERLLDAPSVGIRFRILERALLAKMARPLHPRLSPLRRAEPLGLSGRARRAAEPRPRVGLTRGVKFVQSPDRGPGDNASDSLRP
jgi:hypothetical protein